jgi:L-alanine-DL-glutamate epimerase-like enolase superfamily enzyme
MLSCLDEIATRQHAAGKTPNPFKEGLFKAKFQAVNGYIDVPQKPGLGVELKEGLEELFPSIPGNWNMPDPNFPR